MSILVTETWWRHQMEKISTLLAICAVNSLVPAEFPAQRPVTRSFDVFFDLRLNKRLSKQSWGWWFETPLSPLWRHCNDAPITDDMTTTKQSTPKVIYTVCWLLYKTVLVDVSCSDLDLRQMTGHTPLAPGFLVQHIQSCQPLYDKYLSRNRVNIVLNAYNIYVAEAMQYY